MAPTEVPAERESAALWLIPEDIRPRIVQGKPNVAAFGGY
jgi:hypothetical protein